MLNDLLKDKLRALAEDELMMNAIKAVMYDRLEKNRPVVIEMSDNALLGQKYRALEEARRITEEMFIDIMGYKGQKSGKKFTNKER